MKFSLFGYTIFNTEGSKPVKQERSEILVEVLRESYKSPLKGGERSSVPDSYTLLSLLAGEIAQVEPDFPIQLIKTIRNLATYNGDISYAVDNVVQLANTSYTISFDDKIKPELGKELSALLKKGDKELYKGGVNSLINDLLVQLVITGALSAEAIPANDLKDVRKIVLVQTEEIVFIYDKVKDEYFPHQKTSNVMGGDVGGGLKALNTITYKYYPLRRYSEKPYGMPPFISALESVVIEKEMICSLKEVVKKLGAFGFLNILVKAPTRKPNETDEDYTARLRLYLTEVHIEAEKGFSKGLTIGFKDSAEFKMENTTMNVQGAKELFQLVSEMKFAGLKQDPLMLGRNYNVAETMARVILAKLGTQVVNYQKIVASFLEDVFQLKLLLMGQKVERVYVEFEPAMIGDRVNNETAYGTKLKNLDILYKQGIINQQQYAEQSGYEKPAEAEPRVVVDPAAGNIDDTNSPVKTTDSTKGDIKAHIRDAELNLCIGTYAFPYIKAEEKFSSDLFEFDDPLMDQWFAKYWKASKKKYSAAVEQAVKDIVSELRRLDAVGSDEVLDTIFYNLYTKWGKNFKEPMKKVIRENVEKSYEAFRVSKDLLKGIKDIPDAVFNMTDFRAINFFKNSDSLYLGRFITDPDVKKSITKYVKENYLAGDMPIGKNAAALNKFKSEFGDVLNLKDWKITQILSTTVNRMRNTSGVMYMNQALVEKFMVVGVPDSRQSEFCREIDGTVFEVSKAVEDVERWISSDPSDIKNVSPFGITLINPDKIKSTSSDDLQALGISTPPFHPNCRTTIIAEL